MAPSDLSTWVSDSLMRFGGSEPAVVDFVMSVASSSKSASSLEGKLASMLDGSEADISKFANELFLRAGKTSKSAANGKASTKEKVTEKEKEKKRYAFLPQTQEDVAPPAPKRKENGSEEKVRKHRHREKERKERRVRRREDDFEDRWGDQSQEDSEEELREPSPKRRKRTPSPSRSPSQSDESERERDRKELEELEEKLKNKSKAEKAAAPDVDVSELRIRAREKYLRDREVQKVSLLQKQVEEEAQEEASNTDLTERELKEFKANRELLASALSRLEKRDQAEDRQDFYLQDGSDRKEEVLNKRLKDRQNLSEVQLWEAETMARASATTSGVLASRVKESDYEYVFEESSVPKFMQDAPLASTMSREMQQFNQQVDAAMKKEETLQEQRKQLPMYSYKEQLLDAIEEYQCLVLVGETGSGKSTQVPQFILERHPEATIAVTQPRRVAAMSLAARVAEEHGSRLGQTVGYQVRWESKTTENTKILYATEGIILRQLLADPLLLQYTFVLLDEAHERTINTDVLMAFLKDLLRVRDGSEGSEYPKLTLIIMSATMNAQRFAAYFGTDGTGDGSCPIFNVPGRMYAVQKSHLLVAEANYVSAAISSIFQIHLSMPLPGDILVFMTGQEDIEECAEQIEEVSKKLGNRAASLLIRPLYSTLSSEAQMKVFEPTPPGARKVVIATNIAETSLTIDGVVYVLDVGLEKCMTVGEDGSSSLQISIISKANAEQRAGRAGRVSEGHCLRLYRKVDWTEMQDEPTPAIQREDLSSTVLQLKCLGVDNLLEFDLIDPIPPNSLMRILETLYTLGALNSEGKVTRIGRQMCEIPIGIKLARSVLAAHQLGCVRNVIIVSAMVEESGSLWIRPKDQKTAADVARQRFTHKEGGDHLTLMNIFLAAEETGFDPIWARENFLQYKSIQRARLVVEQMEALMEKIEIDASSSTTDHVPILKALLSGFFQNSAVLMRDGMHYRVITGNQQARIHPSSVLGNKNEGVQLPKAVLFHELAITSAEWLRNCAPIDISWLQEVSPHFWKSRASSLDKLVSKKMPKGQGQAQAAAIKAN